MMTSLDSAQRNLIQQRLLNQHIAGAPLDTPEDVVKWLGAVQSQDYGGAKWAVGQRTRGNANTEVERAFVDGKILRTHVLRPTWHFVLPEDIRWMLMLTGPRVVASMGHAYRQLELDDAIVARSNAVLVRALEGGKALTKAELATAFQRAGIDTHNLMRFGHMIGRAELGALVCSGPLRGKQHTFMLLDERVPNARTLSRDEALAELTRRYFTSHGPATMKDFVWWSGLTVSDIKAGLDMNKSHLDQEVIGDQTYWFAPSTRATTLVEAESPTVYLLPNYDEYIVSYTDRSAIYDQSHNTKLDARGNVLFNNIIVLNGRVVGTWRRTFKKKAVVVELSLFMTLTDTQSQAVATAIKRYGEYLDLPVVMA